MTFGQEMEQVYSYNPGTRRGPISHRDIYADAHTNDNNRKQQPDNDGDNYITYKIVSE